MNDSKVTADIVIDAGLLARMTRLARESGISLEEVLGRSVEAYLMCLESAPHMSAEHARMKALCESHGYTNYRGFASGRDACIARFAFTFAILADMTRFGYGERWCYDTLAHAQTALEEWDGADDGEPAGWHRHPASGRRRPNGDAAREYVMR